MLVNPAKLARYLLPILVMNLILIGLGVVLLLFGRKVFWFSIGAAGFVGGWLLASNLFGSLDGSKQMMIALGIGLACALLALLLQRMAVGLAGFLAGGYLVIAAIRLLELDVNSLTWLFFLLGGLLGTLLALKLFDWALILLSTLCGAMLVAQSSGLELVPAIALFVGLAAAGVLIQAGWQKRQRRRTS
jgi:hypothetical protein